MKNLLLFLVFACTFSFSCLGSPVPFSPIVRNYSVLDYNAGNACLFLLLAKLLLMQ